MGKEIGWGRRVEAGIAVALCDICSGKTEDGLYRCQLSYRETFVGYDRARRKRLENFGNSKQELNHSCF